MMLFITTGIIAATITIAVMSYIFRDHFAAIPLYPPGWTRSFARAYSGALPDMHGSELTSFLGGGDLRINPEHLIRADKLNLKFNLLLSPKYFPDSDALLAEYLPVVIDGRSTEKFGLNNGDLAWVCKRTRSRAFQAGDIVLIKKMQRISRKIMPLKLGGCMPKNQAVTTNG